MADTNTNPPVGGAPLAGNPAPANPQQNLKVNVPDELQKGSYSNAVSVNVNTNEVVVDFGYLLPNTPQPTIEVVSRVNMNHRTAESFLNVLGGAMDDFKKKQASSAAAPAAGPVPQAAPAPAPMPHAAAPAPVAPAPMPPQAPPMPPLPENA